MTASVAENELDIRGLCCTLWRGKRWIIGLALAGMLLAWLWALVVKPVWSTTAVTERPSVNMLGHYYVQQQLLDMLDSRASNTASESPAPSIMDEVYQEFAMQAASWDTRHDFWLQSDYYRQRKENNPQQDAVLLDKLINQIQFTPADTDKHQPDTIRLMAESAAEANQLLRSYVSFAGERAARHLNEGLNGAWQARTSQLQTQVKREESVAQAVFARQVQRLEQALDTARKQRINENRTGQPASALPDSELFLQGSSLLQSQLESLRAAGPTFDIRYDQNRAMLVTLEAGPKLDAQFQTWRYLRTPEEPVTRDSPRRLFLMMMWGCIGALLGAGVALLRRSPMYG